jgi:signal transduction histidine kinase
LASVVDDAWSLNPASAARLTNGVDPRLRALGRPTDLTQVFVNLLSNATKAQEGLRESWIQVEGEEDQRVVRIAVSDGGKRPSDDTVDRMFRTQFTTATAERGTGLGLTICRQIVEEHSGSIWVDRQSENTRIVVELPKPLAAAAQ